MNKSKSDLITTPAAAAHCQVSVPTMKRWIRTGTLSAFQTPGGHYRIDVGEFDRFLRERGRPPYRETPSEMRVLVVDDEPAIVEVLVETLRADPRNLKVESATDGYEALVKVGAFRPSVLILDAVMPRLDGIEVCRRLRMSAETRQVKILGLTGYPDAIPALLQAGAHECLAKPVRLGPLKEALDRLLAADEE